MKVYDDLTPALKTVLLHYTNGYTRWVSIKTTPEKLSSLDAKWAEAYGTHLAAYQRQDKKQKGLPTGVAVAAPVLGEPDTVEVILMATEFASSIQLGPFTREKWHSRLPEFSKFVIVHEPRDRGDYAWTWRIQTIELGQLEKHLTSLVKTGDPVKVAYEAHHWTHLYPMFGGVRRQLRRALKSGHRLWTHNFETRPWPGPDPDNLPAMVGFKKDSSRKPTAKTIGAK